MSDVRSTAPAQVRTLIAIDQHKLSRVAATLPASGGPKVVRLENTERATRRFIEKLGRPEGLAIAIEAGPGGSDPSRRAIGFGAVPAAARLIDSS